MRSRMLVLVCALAASACAKKSSEAAPVGALLEQMPTVDNAAALAPATIELPRVVAFLGADGTMTANDRPKSWDTFVKQDPRRKALDVDAAYLRALVAMADDETPLRKLHGTLGRKVPAVAVEDEPPPPEPEEEEEIVDDESGGVGTAMALDEGRMGKRDTNRMEGQYRMKKLSPEELRQRAREQALAQAHIGGFLATGASSAGIADFTGDKPRPRPATFIPPELPRRLGQVLGETLDGDPLPPVPKLLLVVAPRANAELLVDAVAQNAALLAVAHRGSVRALRVGFLQEGTVAWEPDWEPWMELRVDRDGIVVEAVPGDPVKLPLAFDPKALADALAQARTARGISERVDVDVLVGGGVDTQKLVDILVALDGGGARMFGIGRLPAPGSPELAKRGKRTAIAMRSPIQSVGDLPKPVIMQVLDAANPQVKACYETALAATPDLAGKVSTQFFIKPNGTVMSAHASGVDGELAACVAKVLEGLEFPKPRGGGGVQVNAPFILRR